MTRSLALLFAVLLCALFADAASAQAPADKPVETPKAAEPPKAETSKQVMDAVQKRAPRLSLDSRALPLGATLKNPAAWQAYKARFIAEQGRVIDTGNGNISHSEGQGYAMLLAVAANDRATFDRLWTWTRANLMVRDDPLLAWRWEPAQRPAVADINNASDGDILVAWALTEAAEFWDEMSYRIAGRRIAAELARKLILFKHKLGAVLLPAISGFHEDDRADGPVVNLSYYVFPAFARLGVVAPEVDWVGLTQSGLDLIDTARKTPETLPPDWLSLKDGKAKPADGFPPQFSYNAVRVPLYMAWAGVGEREHYAPFMALVKRTRGALAIVDVTNGKDVASFGDSGIGAIGALVACVWEGAKAPPEYFALQPNDNYYPATLHMLAMVAAQMRYASCLRK